MALVLKDRVLETSQTSGTGTIALSGTVNGFQTFSSAIGNTNTTYYAIIDDADNQWEVGLGTVGAGTLTRDTVYSSSNGGSLVNFGTSIKNVFCDYPASKSVYEDESGNVTGYPISGGTINGTTIGATTPSTGAFTTATASTSVTTPIVKATNSAGLALKNSGGTTQISMGAGGGDNVTVAVSTNLNGTNAQIDISPTGTGHVHIKPTGVNSVEIAPTYVGEMDNITIGSTTPAAGTFTTITGQTEVLKGTGQNLFTQSQNFTTGGWIVGTPAATITANVTTAPDSTSTGNSILSTSTSTNNFVYKSVTSITTTAYTASVYAKKVDSDYLNITFYDGANGSRYWFNISSGTLGSTAVVGSGFTNLSGTITSAGNGWYRCTVTATTLSLTSLQTYFTFTNADASLTQTTAKTNYIWGGQLEIGSTANTYIPTTTTAVYGTPTLSFSGVAGLGLESNGSLYVSPAGTGALQAQATTSSTVGGNARGANAVDWQTARSAATHVASGAQSVVSGGAGNVSSSGYAIVAGGLNNNSSGFGAIISGGSANIASAAWTFVGASTSNTASGQYGSVVCGNANIASGFYGFVGNGFTNSTTANAAVTTQSGTMNATTAVTLSGSNANIKVGQYISGTSIAADTYVAAISGTALTLSKVASGSSTSTLSFFTPHGVVVGGGNNQATGAYSAILGGGDAGTAANRNVASGDWSFVGGGWANKATAAGAVVVGGGNYNGTSAEGNTASGNGSFVGGGASNQATNNFSVAVGGRGNVVNSQVACIVGGTYGSTRGITGNTVFPANYAALGNYGSPAPCQAAMLVLAIQTTNATPAALCSDANAAGSTNQVILPNNSAYFFRGEVVSGVTGGGDTKGWTIEGVIKRGANAASTALVGTPTVTSMYADLGAATWTIAVTADTTNGGLRVTFTGQASTTIRTVCQIRTTEMTY